MRKIFYILLFFLVSSCNNINFVYNDKENLINPLYEKTAVTLSGLDLVFVNSYVPNFFGVNKAGEYDLSINIEQEKTKRSVEVNQATSTLRYELRFLYTLRNNLKNCEIYQKEIVSYFSIIPKSSGYNYGTDASLEKKYELVVVDNLNRFMSFLPDINISNCP